LTNSIGKKVVWKHSVCGALKTAKDSPDHGVKNEEVLAKVKNNESYVSIIFNPEKIR